MDTKQKFSIKADYFTSTKAHQPKAVDGPWKSTREEAVQAFLANLQKKGIVRAFNAHLVEQASEAEAAGKDSRGKYYIVLRDHAWLKAAVTNPNTTVEVAVF